MNKAWGEEGEGVLSVEPSNEPVLSVRDLRKAYRTGRSSNAVLKGVTFEVRPGDIVGILGRNGSGKTTLFKCLCGLLEPDSGEMIFHSRHSQQDGSSSHPVLLLEGDRNFYLRLSVQHNLEYFGTLKELTKSQLRERIPRLLDDFNLSDKRFAQVKELSRGMKQKVGLASCLIANPNLIFLDEPTLGLDVESRLYLKDKVKDLSRQDRAILLSSHELGFVEDVATRILFLEDGVVSELADFSKKVDQMGHRMIVKLRNGIPNGIEDSLQKFADLKVDQNRQTIELCERDLANLLAVLDVSLIDSVSRKLISLEDLFRSLDGNSHPAQEAPK